MKWVTCGACGIPTSLEFLFVVNSNRNQTKVGMADGEYSRVLKKAREGKAGGALGAPKLEAGSSLLCRMALQLDSNFGEVQR